jgi:hypothetical protein
LAPFFRLLQQQSTNKEKLKKKTFRIVMKTDQREEEMTMKTLMKKPPAPFRCVLDSMPSYLRAISV